MLQKSLKRSTHLVIISAIISFLIMSSFDFVFAVPPPPPCNEYTIDEKEALNDVLNSPQMTPLSNWELAEYQFSKCASYGIFQLSLKYILPENLSNLGFRYVSQFPSIRLSVDTKKAESSSLDIYNRLATEAKSAIQSAENNNRVKEFINKVGAEEYIFGGHIWFRNDSLKSSIQYSYDNQQVFRYTIPVDIAWQNYPETSRFRSIFRKEIPSENCSLDFRDGTISSGQYDEKDKTLWRFNQTVKGTGCPSWILVDIYDDGTYKAQVDPTVPIPGSGSSKNKVIVTKKSKDLYSVELTIQDYRFGTDNASRISDISLIENGKEYYVIDPDKNGNFGTKRDYMKESDIEGIHINVGGEDCEPIRQNIWFTLMTKEKRYYRISDLRIDSIENVKNIWINHAPEPICYDCPGWKPDPNYCKDYETFSERPVDKIVVERSCSKGPDYCYGTVMMRPFLYSPVDKRLKVIKKMSFNINISEEELKVKGAAEVSAVLIEQKQLSSVQSIQLKHEEEKPTYEVVGVRKTKLLFFIPISLKIRLEVNAVTGQIMIIKKPWWSFLVF